MKSFNHILAAGVVAVSVAMSGFASAETLRWARSGDSLTLDPHAQNEGPTHALAHQIYEPLLHRDMDRQIHRALPPAGKRWTTTQMSGGLPCARA